MEFKKEDTKETYFHLNKVQYGQELKQLGDGGQMSVSFNNRWGLFFSLLSQDKTVVLSENNRRLYFSPLSLPNM